MIQIYKNDNTDENFTNAYRSFYPFVLKYCIAKSGGDVQLAEDCTQEAFYVLYQKYCNNIEIENPRAFLIKSANIILTKKHSSKVKYESHIIELENASEIPDDSFSFGEIEYNDLIKRLDSLLEEPDKTIFHLRYVEEKSMREISDITGISVTNITTRISRFRNKLKKEIKEWRRSEK